MCCCISTSLEFFDNYCYSGVDICCNNIVECCCCERCIDNCCRTSQDMCECFIIILAHLLFALPEQLIKCCVNNCCGHNCSSRPREWDKGDLLRMIIMERPYVTKLDIHSEFYICNIRYDIREIPSKISKLTNLETLNITYTKIVSIPAEIGTLQHLISLDLHNNLITTVHQDIGKLTNLQVLNFNNNQLTFLPESIGNLTNLQILELNKNQLTFLPESIGNLTNLTKLCINENNLATLPNNIKNLKQLVFIQFQDNNFTLFPTQLSFIHTLTRVYFNYSIFRTDNRPVSKMIMEQYFKNNKNANQKIKSFLSSQILFIQCENINSKRNNKNIFKSILNCENIVKKIVKY